MSIVLSSRSMRSRPQNKRYIAPPVAPPLQIAYSAPQPKKPSWGSVTWILLHTLCQKMRLEKFESLQKRQEFRDILISICVNLPCPDCSNHSKNYIKTTEFDKKIFRTKEDLMAIFFAFHNKVNERKGYTPFPSSELDQYTRVDTMETIKLFFLHFDTKNKLVPRMLSEDYYRKQVIRGLYKWFSSNIDCFDA